MTGSLPAGLYDLLQTPQLKKRLEESGLMDEAIWGNVDPVELPNKIALHLARELSAYLAETVFSNSDLELWQGALNQTVRSPEFLNDFLPAILPESDTALQRIKASAIPATVMQRPDTPLTVSALLTGSSRSPALRTQLQKELSSCDRADWLVSFIKLSGILPLLDTLRTFTQTPASDGGPRLRIATTSYMGATDIKAIEALLKLPNTEIRISYDTKRTRLHAKAYLFHRLSGFSSAYIGSANVSKAALDEGLEWTVKVSQYETEHLWQHAIATFESHWEDDTEFSECKAVNLPELRQALANEQSNGDGAEISTFFDLNPYGYQKAILEDIIAERVAGKLKHLVIAATGTGKTMVAAFDYKAFCAEHHARPRLLFLAHREEILKQARASFRHVLRDGSFGELVSGYSQPNQFNHLFCTVQSWNSKDFSRFPPDYFDYVVLDEAHHATAASYQALISHIQPKALLGLTATPERSDGGDIRDDFGGVFTHEIRLPEAIERALLCPFHYYGIPDLDGLDFSALAWRRGGYDRGELDKQIGHNLARAHWVIGQADRYLPDLNAVRGLGFCISVQHAAFMANYCNDHGYPSMALSAQSPREERLQAQRKLEQREIRFIFSVDLYNEGVDIPCVDTVLFLRPTESLTLFLQQLGRGLRLNNDKPHLTVLDFIAPQNRQFRYAKRFQALSSRPELHTQKQIENDMPFIPTGCIIHLERQAKEHVLKNITDSTAALRGLRLTNELRELQRMQPEGLKLQQILDHLNMDTPEELYRRGLPSVLLAKADKKDLDGDVVQFSGKLKDGFRRLSQMDDTCLIADAKKLFETGHSDEPLTRSLIHCLLWGKARPDSGSLNDVHTFLASKAGLKHDLSELLEWLLKHRTPMLAKRIPDKTGPLILHASYTREQILLALDEGSFEDSRMSREGVLHLPNRRLDLFFADINKAESDFSPTTMYEDYAISDRLFHWQSQSSTSDETKTGRRYIEHEQMGYTPMLFIRNRKKSINGLTSPYLFAGPLSYVKHYGSKPMSIHWKMLERLPARVLPWAKRDG
ncbi:MAG: DUF3427 domain-containing protein [Mariprofundus sp.]|nr:DUF3427 domain-containing protein [Mariprofundus sp.]